MKKISKIISLLMLMIIFISLFQNIVLGTFDISSAIIIADHTIDTGVEFFDGTSWSALEAKYVVYKDENNKKYPAYCVSHGLDGVDERGDYDVDITGILEDTRIWRAIINGFPYKSASQIGVDSDDDAYVATKQAIYCVIINRDVSLYRGVTASGRKIVKAIEKLKEIGLHQISQQPEYGDLIVQKSGTLTEENDHYSQKYKVTSDGNINDFNVSKITGFPNNSYVANSKGESQTSFNVGETFKIMIPKTGFNKNINGTISVTSDCQIYPILYRQN